MKNNRISQLPATQDWSLYHLRNLDLSHNLLKHESLQYYTRQNSTSKRWFRRQEDDELTIALTEIEFPQCVCSSLISLNLSNNPIMDIPWSIFEMKQLQVLKLDGLPNLERLPKELGKLNNLHRLSLDGTNISYPPEVKELSDGVQSTSKINVIKQVLWNKLYDCRTSRVMKLIIIGPEKSGKTHLVTRLTDSAWPMEDKGVNIQNWCLAFTKKQRVGSPGEIQFTVWDLKGGSSYATVNQCMLTHRAMYILVWDLRNGKEEISKLQQWILNIKSQCRGLKSRIIIAGTHLDKIRGRHRRKVKNHIGFYSQQLIGDKFPELRENMIDVDGEETGFESIVNLKRLLFCTASNIKYRSRFNALEQPFAGRQIPGAHMILMDRINDKAKIHQENSTPPIMTEEELITIIGTIPSHRIETPREIDEAVQYLQDCGRVLCVTDHTYRLTRLYFLDPSWLCDALMDAMHVKNSSYEQELPEGIVATERLKAIGKQHGFSEDTVEDYLQLLARFEIAFPHSEGR
ncbi:leucine-rich repeat serine/threonine-protein kinase 1-like [Amphiura filiformis]|uniref:leucine-rich repeat serine/threonine-protein kinase 1-like n=1 Tax=Amphiura filiformis TaxID=82378 RepID=UPI003B21AA5C